MQQIQVFEIDEKAVKNGPLGREVRLEGKEWVFYTDIVKRVGRVDIYLSRRYIPRLKVRLGKREYVVIPKPIAKYLIERGDTSLLRKVLQGDI